MISLSKKPSEKNTCAVELQIWQKKYHVRPSALIAIFGKKPEKRYTIFAERKDLDSMMQQLAKEKNLDGRTLKELLQEYTMSEIRAGSWIFNKFVPKTQFVYNASMITSHLPYAQ